MLPLVAAVILAALLLAAGARWYGARFVRQAFLEPVGVHARLVGRSESSVTIELLATGGTMTIVDACIERSFHDALGLSPPPGFLLEPLRVDERDKDDPDEVEYVSEWNRDHARYAAQLQLLDGKAETLVFLVQSAAPLHGEIRFGYKRRIGLGAEEGQVAVALGGAVATGPGGTSG